MKKILLIFILAVISVTAFSQSVGYPYQNLGSTWGNNMEGVNVKKAFYLPKYNDTTTILTLRNDSLGLMFVQKNVFPNKIWYRDSVSTGGHKWTEIGSGSGGSQGFQDVLAVDPDLTQNNTIGGGQHYFAIDNTSGFEFNATDGGGNGSSFLGAGTFGRASVFATSEIVLDAGDSIFTVAQPPQYTGSSTYSIGWEAGKFVSTNPGVVVTGNVYYAIDSTNTPPGSPATGDVYMVGGAGTGAWSGRNYDIATWNGASWDFTDPTTGDIAVVTSTKKTYKYNGSTWVITGGIPLLVGGNNLNTFLEFGALSNNGVAWITNGLRRISITNGGAITFNRGSNAYTFPSSNTAGVLTNNGSGTLTWSPASGLQTWQQTLTTGSTLNQNNTITATGFGYTHNGGRFTVNVDDSLLLSAATKISFASLDSLNGRASVNWFKSARAFWAASSLAYIGVDSVGFRIQNGLIYALGATTGTGSIGRIDPTTKALGYSSTINAATELTGIVPVANGGTGLATLTANNLMVGNGTGNVTFIAPSTSGNVLTSNGTTWVSSAPAGTSPFTRGVMPGVNSLNMIYQVTQSDSAVFGVLTSGTPSAKYHFTGTGHFSNSLRTGGDMRVDGNIAASFTTPSAAWIFQANALGTSGGVHIQGATSTNGTIYYTYDAQNGVGQTSAASGGLIGFNSRLGDGGTTAVTAQLGGFDNNITFQGNNITTAFPMVWGYRNRTAHLGTGSAQSKAAVYNAFWDRGLATQNSTDTIISNGGRYTGLRLDSSWFIGSGSIFGIQQFDNGAKQIINTIEGKTSIGTTTSPTSLLMLGAGTATVAAEKYIAGTLLSSVAIGAKEYNNAFYSTNNALNRYAEGGAIADFTSDGNNSGTGETDLQTYTTKASTLAETGEKIIYDAAGTFNDITSTGQLQFYFAGTNIGNTGALTISATGGWSARIIIIRTGASTARSLVTVTTPGASTAIYTTETDIAGLTFTNTNIIKITGTAGGAGGGSNDITSKLGTIAWWGAANN